MHPASWNPVVELNPAQAERGLVATVVVGRGDDTTSLEVEGVKLGLRSVSFPFPWSLPVGTHAWVEVALPTGGVIRPLVTILKSERGKAAARYVHLFPEQRRALERHLRSDSGY